ncbi:MAG: SRPBCC family protein [Anaeromyxobacteraceae bacterium]
MKTFPSVRHIGVTVARPPAEVYAFAADPRNLPLWANGLSGSIEEVDGEWLAESPMGKVKVHFTQPNDLGVLDHDVVLGSGVIVHNPMRVIANGEGSEVVFTLFRRPEMTDAEFTADAGAVERDVAALKRLLEERAGRE